MPQPDEGTSRNGTPAWRSAFDGYLPAGRSSGPGTGLTSARLGLQFQVRELIPRTTYRWNGPTSQAATASTSTAGADPRIEYRLGVRPVVRTAKGWARGGVTWSNIPHVKNRLDLDPQQHRWFCEFVALHRAAAPATTGQDPDWVFLDDFVNPVLWALLDQARALGIPFVGTAAAATPQIASEAAVRLDITRDGPGLRVTPRLVVDGVLLADGRAGAIGTHGIYRFDPARPRDMVIGPTDEPLDPESLALVRAFGSADSVVAVPAAGIEDFLSEVLPQLRRSLDVTSADGSVPLPATPPPLLVLAATFGPKHRLALEWHWERVRRTADAPALESVLPDRLLPAAWIVDGGVGATPTAAVLSDLEAAEFVATVLPELRARPGIRVETFGVAPDYRELTGVPRLTITTVPTERVDWFDLGITIHLDGRAIPFVPLFKALSRGTRRIMLADGAYLALNHPAFGPLRELIEEAKELSEWETRPTISRYQTSLWADFEDLADEARPAVEWRALLAEVGAAAPQPVDQPIGLRATLRPYQTDGLAWLTFLWRHGLGGVLADDMGLGKTLQCLALVQHLVESAPDARLPFLVVAPTSVVSNWAAEARRFTPDLVVCTISATESTSGVLVAASTQEADIVVTSYALLRLDFDAYQSIAQRGGWAGLILDEAQFVKNASSRGHECARDLAVRSKLAVTGTPMENSLAELHAVFAIVAPGLFPSLRRFTEQYVGPIERPQAGISRGRGAGSGPAALAELRASRLARLRARMRPFLLRRTKELVATELPPKQEQVLRIALAPAHRALYDLWLQRERQKLFRLLPDLDRNRFIVFRSLTLLRMLALDASLLGDEYAHAPSSKLDALLEQLDDVLAEGHRALVFSQFTSYLKVAAARLDAAGIRYAYLDGSTRHRDDAVAEFRDGDATVFLISLKAGGFGLNLADADYVFLLDPWWNPATEEQAIDRAHRIGQTRPVMVYRLVAADTIEDRVMALKERKAQLFDAVIDDEALFGSLLTADDVRDLLA